MADPAAGWDKGYRALNSLANNEYRQRQVIKNLHPFLALTSTTLWFIIFMWTNKALLLRTSLYCSLTLFSVFHHTKKLPRFIARPPTWFPVKVSLHCKQLIPNLKFLTTFNSSSFHTQRSINGPGRGLSSETKVHKHCFQIEAKTKERFVGLSGFWIASERERSYHPYRGLKLTRVKGLNGLIMEHGLIKHHWSVGSLVNFNFI